MDMPAAATAPAREIPGDAGWPIIGHSLDQFRLDRAIHERHARYGEVSWSNAFGARWITLLGPDGNQLLLQNRDDAFASSAWEHFLANFFHRGLMLLDFDEHRMHRRIMQAAFTREALVGYLQLMNPRIGTALAEWAPAERFGVYDRIKRLSLDLASEAFIGHPTGAERERLTRAFLETLRGPTDVLRLNLPGTRWRKGIVGRRILEDYFRRELPAKRATDSLDLFARLCHARTEGGEQFSDEDVINHIIFVLMAAHDTSTITLCNLIYHLAREPQWQERLRADSRALGEAVPGFDGLQQLEALGWAMKEAMRLCAPVPGVPRRAVRDVEFKGFRIPAGALVNNSIWFTHTSPLYWNAPERFDPERFSPARAEDRKHPFLYAPFGGGAHKCIGMFFGEMEVKAVVHQLLLRFRWSVPAGYVMKQDFTTLPMPKDGLPVRLERL
jgi:cytochrome P450